MSGAAIQRRSAVLEVRAKGRRLEGYAALFGVRANIAGVGGITGRAGSMPSRYAWKGVFAMRLSVLLPSASSAWYASLLRPWTMARSALMALGWSLGRVSFISGKGGYSKPIWV